MVLLPVTALTLSFGATRPWIWQTISGFYLIACAFLLTAGTVSIQRLFPRSVLLPGAAILAVPVLQMLPLPQELLHILSPVRSVWSDGLASFGYPGTATITYSIPATMQRLLWWTTLFIYAAMSRHLLRRHPDSLRMVLFFLFGLGTLEAAYGILQALVPKLGVLWDIAPSSGRAYARLARGTFINRNHFSCFINLLWPISGILVLQAALEHGRRTRQLLYCDARTALACFCLVFMLLSLLLSQSRGGIVSAGAILASMVLLAGSNRKRAAVLLVVCGTLIAVYASIIGTEELGRRFLLLKDGMTDRLAIWQDGWDVAMAHPLTGTGLGTYPDAARAYQTGLSAGQQAHHAHNDYLETIAETGFPLGGLLILGIWGTWLSRAWVLWRTRLTNDRHHLPAVATLAALGGYLVHAWVDFNSAIPANHALAVLIFVIHLHCTRRLRPGACRSESTNRSGTADA